MLTFKVYANNGQMFCGYLSVVDGFSHNFLNRDNQVACSRSTVDKVAGYKHLKLVRV